MPIHAEVRPSQSPSTFGLIAWLEQTRVRLPLKGIECAFTVHGCLAEVAMHQIYYQENDRALDCQYVFPLPAEAAVYECVVEINGRVIQAQVEERQHARELAAQHKTAGHRTVLVESERENLFTLSLGNLQSHDLIQVRLAYFQPLSRLADQLSLEIPFCPGVRYIPGRPLLRSNVGRGAADDTDQVPDASRINPSRIDQLHPDAAYLSLEGRIDGSGVDSASLISPTHSIVPRVDGEDMLVTLGSVAEVPDRDFVVRWKEQPVDAVASRGWIYRDGPTSYALIEARAPEQSPAADGQPVDFYFLVDRSGSMEGVKWQKAVEALQACVRTLGENDRAMVTMFESTYADFAESPYPSAQLLADPKFRDLVQLGTGGGTEMGPAFDHVLGLVERHSGSRRANLVLITDAQVGNEGQILRTVARLPNLAVHCFGIDDALNDTLLVALARQQRGTFHSLKPADDIAGAVQRLGQTLRQPVFLEMFVSKDWETADAAIPDLYAGQVNYMVLRTTQGEPSLEVCGRNPLRQPLTLRFNLREVKSRGPLLWWHKRRIERRLAEENQAEAVQLSKASNLVCPVTAFVAWDSKEKVAVATEELIQPALSPSGNNQFSIVPRWFGLMPKCKPCISLASGQSSMMEAPPLFQRLMHPLAIFGKRFVESLSELVETTGLDMDQFYLILADRLMKAPAIADLGSRLKIMQVLVERLETLAEQRRREVEEIRDRGRRLATHLQELGHRVGLLCNQIGTEASLESVLTLATSSQEIEDRQNEIQSLTRQLRESIAVWQSSKDCFYQELLEFIRIHLPADYDQFKAILEIIKY
jgi:Ca-activated chloride channel homolog